MVLKANADRSPTCGLADVIVGIQWGDEGKGRVVDYHADSYDLIARFGGGDNAGHTIVCGKRKVALRIVPSGVLQNRPLLFIGGGTVVSLATLVSEFEMLANLGIDIERIRVSDRAHIVLPYHAAQERATEKRRGAHAIGTTGRGIGPAYVDKAGRVGITFGDLHRPTALAEKIAQRYRLHGDDAGAGVESPPVEAVIEETLTLGRRVLPHVVDGVRFIQEMLQRDCRVLIEGAQGTMLDVGYGTYPFVTSSHTIAGAACTGLGIGPRSIGSVVGVAKAYCTRVGAGPFPSELHGATAEWLRERGAEFGTVTGRPRRCGWFDAVAARYATQVNGLTSVILTKLDVLSGLERVGVVVSYARDGAPISMQSLADEPLQTEVEWHEGWGELPRDARRLRDLPGNAGRYVEALQRALQVPIQAVSFGAERSEMALS